MNFYNSTIFGGLFAEVINKDFSLAVFALLFVFIYMMIHLKSFFLAVNGACIIVLSFPISLVITNGVFKVTYFGFLHAMVIFIVVGIAADDIFVFVDGWKQSEKVEQFKGDPKRRMAYAFRRAVRAMAVTSSTTSVAFFANFFSPLMPIKAFGIFAGTIIPVNYFLVVLIFPPATIFYERWFENSGYCFWKNCCAEEVEIEESESEEIAISSQPEPLENQSPEERYTATEKFFRNPWNAFVRWARWPIVLVTLLWFQFAVSKAVELGPLTEEEVQISKDEPVMYTSNLLAQNFTQANPKLVTVNFVFGVKDINKTGGDSLWNSSFVGEVIFDPDFDPKLQRVQTAMKSFCLQLRKQSFVVEDSESCWIDDFDDWLRTKYRVRIPVEEDEYYTYLNEWTSDPPIGTKDGARARRRRTVGMVNGTMMYSEFSAQSNITRKDPSSIKQPEYDLWEEFIDNWRKTAPKELKAVY